MQQAGLSPEGKDIAREEEAKGCHGIFTALVGTNARQWFSSSREQKRQKSTRSDTRRKTYAVSNRHYNMVFLIQSAPLFYLKNSLHSVYKNTL